MNGKAEVWAFPEATRIICNQVHTGTLTQVEQNKVNAPVQFASEGGWKAKGKSLKLSESEEEVKLTNTSDLHLWKKL